MCGRCGVLYLFFDGGTHVGAAAEEEKDAWLCGAFLLPQLLATSCAGPVEEDQKWHGQGYMVLRCPGPLCKLVLIGLEDALGAEEFARLESAKRQRQRIAGTAAMVKELLKGVASYACCLAYVFAAGHSIRVKWKCDRTAESVLATKHSSLNN